MKVLGEKGQELSNTQSDLKEAQVALLFPVRLSAAELDAHLRRVRAVAERACKFAI